MAPLNKALIPTGILAENSYPLLDLSVYNGQLSADNTLDFAQWRLLYNQALSGAYVAPVGLPNIAQLNTDYNTARNNGVNNVVSLSLINYASIKPTAITDGFMTASNGQLFDNNPGSKYQTNKLFIAAAVNNTAKNGVLNLFFSPNLFYTNTGVSITNVQVDFGNGNGFVPAAFNTTISGFYTSIGNKQLIYKITFSDANVVQCYNNVYVPYIPSSGSARYAEAPRTATGADIPDVILTSPNNAAHSGVELFIRRSVTNTAGTNADPQFRKPLIIVEGLDLSSATSLVGNGYNYNNFRNEIIADQTRFTSATNPFQPFDQYLDDVAGYDLIFVNWHDGVDDILRNVLALRDVINFVNTHKQAGAQQNVVLGISMGGLVSRYCLAQMVKAGGTGINAHQTRLLITHDSPHRGANIPLALQHLLQGLRKQKVKAFLGIYNKRLDEIIPQFMDVNTAINSPAATQQLLARVVDDNGTLSYNTFLDGAYRTMINFAGTGFTQPYRFVATSNGSQCGIPVAAPYSQLASLDAEGIAFLFGLKLWTKGRAYLDMRRLPDIGQTSSILNFNLKLKVKILVFNLLKISMQIQKNAPGNLLPLDGLAGGTRDLGGAALSANLSTVPPASGSSNWLIFGYSYNYSTPYIAPTFSFVPTTSSLDVVNFNAVNIPYSVPVTGLNGSRSENYIAQESITLAAPIGVTNNVNHTDFYARTCNWLYNEMENLPQTTSCLDHCGITTINGPATLCGTSTYTVLNLPPGSTVIWSATPAGLVSFGSPNLTQTTVSQTGSGTTTLRVTISNACNSPAVTKTISVGAPSPNSYSVLGAATVYASAGYYYSAGYLGNATFVTNPFWRVPADWTIVSGQGTNNIQVMTGNTGGAVELDFDNVCGERTGVFKTVEIGFGGPPPLIVTDPQSRQSSATVLTVLATPNPANNNVTIALVSQETGTKRSTMNVIEQIRITDKTGMQKRQFSFKSRNSSQNISLSGLVPDTYVVQVFNGEQWLSSKLLVL